MLAIAVRCSRFRLPMAAFALLALVLVLAPLVAGMQGLADRQRGPIWS